MNREFLHSTAFSRHYARLAKFAYLAFKTMLCFLSLISSELIVSILTV